MANQTCFVVMPIGAQEYVGGSVTSEELKSRYDDLIKEALLKADPSLEVTRADEVAAPGTITSDIILRLMNADHVVADITFPNPNVFYELGLRHACRLGTIILREKDGPKAPFDLAHLRHIEYENTPSGLKRLAADLGSQLSHRREHPDTPDNQFQEVARMTGFPFPNYVDQKGDDDLKLEAMMALLKAPELLELAIRTGPGEEMDTTEFIRALAKNPEGSSAVMQALVKSGQVSLSGPSSTSKPKTTRKPRASKSGGRPRKR